MGLQVVLVEEGSTLVWLPRAGCALLWTASGSELLCFSSFAFHLELRTAECLCHLILVSVCVVTNRTKNHDRIAYMWKKHAVVGAGKCKVSLRSAQCFMQHGLDFCGLLKVWFSEPFPFSGIRPQAGWDGMFGVYLTPVGMRWLAGDLQFGWASGFRISWTPVRTSWYV